MSNSLGSGTLGRLVDSYRTSLVIAVWIINILFVLGGAIAGWAIGTHFSYGRDGSIVALLFGGSIGGFYSWFINVFVIAPQAVLLTIRDEIQRLNDSNDALVRALAGKGITSNDALLRILAGKDTASNSASDFRPYVEHGDDEPITKVDANGSTWTSHTVVRKTHWALQNVNSTKLYPVLPIRHLVSQMAVLIYGFARNVEVSIQRVCNRAVIAESPNNLM